MVTPETIEAERARLEKNVTIAERRFAYAQKQLWRGEIELRAWERAAALLDEEGP